MDRKKKKYRIKNSPKVEKMISAWRDEAAEPTDVLGWYTGVPAKRGENEPEQDSDDL